MPKRAKNNAQAAAAAPVEPQITTAAPKLAGHKPAKVSWPQTPVAKLDLMEPDATQPTIADIFGPGGAVEQCMPDGYEHRPSQLEMAELVEAAFTEKRHLI